MTDKDYFPIEPDPPLPKYEPPEGPPNPNSRTMMQAIWSHRWDWVDRLKETDDQG